jgi:replicative DNA helicase
METKRQKIDPLQNAGYIPPNDHDIEECVLAALLIDEDCRDEVLPILHEGCFYEAYNLELFRAIQALSKAGKEIDPFLVKAAMPPGTFDAAKNAAMVNKIGSGAHVVQHSQYLCELAIRRSVIDLGHKAVKMALDMPASVDDILSYIQRELLALSQFDGTNVSDINSVIDDVFQIMKKNAETEHALTGIGTGLRELDNFSGGLQRTDLVVIAGATSQGKTSLALTIAKNAAMRFGAKVAFYSLEMSKVQLVARLMAQETGVSSKDILTRGLGAGMLSQIAEKTFCLGGAPIYFDDRSTTGIDSILRSIRSMKTKYGIDMAVVDYLQLVSTSTRGMNREQQVAEIARSLKNLAKDLNICIIALSQISRSDNPKPTLNRLRDSGQIEEAADTILFTYRPEVYGKDYDEPFRHYSRHDTAMIDMAKGRNTGTFQFIVSFSGECTLFYDYSGGFCEKIERDPF